MSRNPRRRPRGAALSVRSEAAARTVLAFYEQGLGPLVPLVLLLLVMAVVIGLIALAGPITPFLYPLF